MQTGLTEALRHADSLVDWTKFTSHGDTLDLVVFVQPAKDGACGGAPGGASASTNNHIWAHRATLNPPFITHSPAPAGGSLTVVDYIIQSGVGGEVSCDTTQIMPIGTVAHETAAAGAYVFRPAPMSDTAFLVRPTGANPRGEYFLLENREPVLADSALIRNA